MTKDPIGILAGDLNLYRYVGNNVVNWIDPLGLKRKWVKKLMLVTSYCEMGPGSDWAYFASKVGIGLLSSVGPGTVAVANPDKPKTGKPFRPAQPIYPYGSSARVFGKSEEILYDGRVHDTGRGWDQKHHKAAPDQWIDIGLNKAEAKKWGKQWKEVEICKDDGCP